MDFSDLIALKIKELMKEKDMTIYKLETLSGVYSFTIAQFLTRKTIINKAEKQKQFV